MGLIILRMHDPKMAVLMIMPLRRSVGILKMCIVCVTIRTVGKRVRMRRIMPVKVLRLMSRRRITVAIEWIRMAFVVLTFCHVLI